MLKFGTCRLDLEIEAVMVVDAGLPYIRGFVILLGPERAMLEVCAYSNDNERRFRAS